LNLKRKLKLSVALFLIVCALGTLAYGMMQRYHEHGNQGKVKGVRVMVYQTDNATELTTLNWGWVDEPSTNTYLCYVESTANYNVTLSKTETDWVSTPFNNASLYMTQTWNYSGQVLVPNQRIPILLTLTIIDIPDFGIEDFSYITTITASSQQNFESLRNIKLDYCLWRKTSVFFNRTHKLAHDRKAFLMRIYSSHKNGFFSFSNQPNLNYFLIP